MPRNQCYQILANFSIEVIYDNLCFIILCGASHRFKQ